MLLAALVAEENWDEAFAQSQDKLALLANEALAEHHNGKTKALEEIL